MSLFKYGIAGAIGYYVGQPQGRKHVARLRRQLVRLSKQPRVKQLQERGWDVAYDRAVAVKRLATTLPGKKKTAEQATVAPTPVDDADRTSPVSSNALDAPVLQATERPSPDPATAPTVVDPAPTGFGGRTVAEDSEAVRTGVIPPPPPGRTTPSSSTDQP